MQESILRFRIILLNIWNNQFPPVVFFAKLSYNNQR